MSNQAPSENYDVRHYPKSRLATFDVGKIGRKKHHIIGLLEIDVTLARQKIRAGIQAGRKIGFNAWILKIIGTSISRNNQVHAINHGRQTHIAFRNVDISITVEKSINGQKVPLALVIRQTNQKSIEEIQSEIQAAVTHTIDSVNDYVLGKKSGKNLNRIFFNLPQWARLGIWRFLLANPFIRRNTMGTVMVTNIGMTGVCPGWIIPKSLHNLAFGIGSITKKPWIHNHQIEIRDILNLTILFDHDVVDGVPAAQFTDKLVRNLQSAPDL